MTSDIKFFHDGGEWHYSGHLNGYGFLVGGGFASFLDAALNCESAMKFARSTN